MAKLSQLVGGTWINYRSRIRCRESLRVGIRQKSDPRRSASSDKGGPHETQIEAISVRDPVNNTVYYLDCHGGTSVFKGTVKLEGEDLIFEFATIIGKPATWREVLHSPTKTPCNSRSSARKMISGSPSSNRRQTPAASTECIRASYRGHRSPRRLTTVWAAFTTKEGQESWNVAHAEIDLKIGGKMLTHYDPAGRIGDPNTIENIILCFEPRRMLVHPGAKPTREIPIQNRDQEDVDRDLF